MYLLTKKNLQENHVHKITIVPKNFISKPDSKGAGFGGENKGVGFGIGRKWRQTINSGVSLNYLNCDTN